MGSCCIGVKSGSCSFDVANPLINSILGNSDPGSYFKGELEEAISPVTARMERLEKKLDILNLTLERIEKLLLALQPLAKALSKLPFFK